MSSLLKNLKKVRKARKPRRTKKQIKEDKRKEEEDKAKLFFDIGSSISRDVAFEVEINPEEMIYGDLKLEDTVYTSPVVVEEKKVEVVEKSFKPFDNITYFPLVRAEEPVVEEVSKEVEETALTKLTKLSRGSKTVLFTSKPIVKSVMKEVVKEKTREVVVENEKYISRKKSYNILINTDEMESQSGEMLFLDESSGNVCFKLKFDKNSRTLSVFIIKTDGKESKSGSFVTKRGVTDLRITIKPINSRAFSVKLLNVGQRVVRTISQIKYDKMTWTSFKLTLI